MHVGHLRSTIIGDTVCRLLEFVGHDVHVSLDSYLGSIEIARPVREQLFARTVVRKRVGLSRYCPYLSFRSEIV